MGFYSGGSVTPAPGLEFPSRYTVGIVHFPHSEGPTATAKGGPSAHHNVGGESAVLTLAQSLSGL